MNLFIDFHHGENFLGIEKADMVYGIGQAVGAGCAVPAEFPDGRRGRSLRDSCTHAQTIT